MFPRFSAFRRNAQQTQRGFDGRPGASRFLVAGLGAAQRECTRAVARTLLANPYSEVFTGTTDKLQIDML